MRSDVFRFNVIRPIEAKELDDSEIIRSDQPGNAENVVLRTLTAVRKKEGSSIELLRREASALVNDDEKRKANYKKTIGEFDEALKELDSRNVSDKKYREEIIKAKGLISDSIAKGILTQLFGSLCIAMIGRIESSDDAATISHSIRAMSLVRRLVNADVDEKKMDVAGAFEATIILPKGIFPLPKKSNSKNKEKSDSAKDVLEKEKEKVEKLSSKLRRNKAAIRELKQAYDVDTANGAVREKTEREDKRKTRKTEKPSFWSRLFGTSSTLGKVSISNPDTEVFLLSKESISELSQDTIDVVKEAGWNPKKFGVGEVVNSLERQNSNLGRSLYVGGSLTRASKLAGNFTLGDIEGPHNEVVADFDIHVPGNCPPIIATETELEEATVPGGEGKYQKIEMMDLLVVKQQIKRYELGEVAHIENVMAGEERSRKHRALNREEVKTVFETESNEVNETNLASTERFELQNESQKVIEDDSNRHAGITVSGSYGPSVSFEANAGASIDSSKSKSSGTAVSSAKELTERSVQRIQERVRDERSTLSISEVEVINKHEFINQEPQSENIVGVYRWIDKIYEAQVFNYGMREQIEIVTPEPGALLRFFATTAAPEGASVKKPFTPGYCSGLKHEFEPLEPKHLNESNYQYWISRYNATGVEAPPPSYVRVGLGLAKEDTDESRGMVLSADNTLKVPVGYTAKKAAFAGGTFVYTVLDDGEVVIERDANVSVYVGKKDVASEEKSMAGESGTIPITLVGSSTPGVGGNVIVECAVSKEHYDEWQIDTYEKIMIAYNELLSEYESSIRNAEIFEETSSIQGRNPLSNRLLEERELKRLSISQMTGQHFDDFDAMRRNVGEDGYPQHDINEAFVEGQYIRFVEQAFEWENMQYMFYPYFWGRKDDWPQVSQLTDEDPLFEAFLQAGSARVNVPVRPGFEDAVNTFLSGNGTPWSTSSGSVISEEDPFLSLVDEIKSIQGVIDVKSNGKVSITNGSPNVSGKDTTFSEDDVNREISLGGETYMIKERTSDTSITLASNYNGTDLLDGPYVIGAKAVGAPWNVRIPTKLVKLQKDAKLPSFD